MELADVLSCLCCYDPRNPDYYDIDENWENAPPPRDNCHCDNCFYGRDKLAIEILRLRDLTKEGRQ